MGHVVILGVFVADTAYRANRMPRIGETVLGNSFALGPGGKGSNQAVAAGRTGVKVSILGLLLALPHMSSKVRTIILERHTYLLRSLPVTMQSS